MNDVLKNCVEKCQKCKTMCEKMNMEKCVKVCNDCEILCNLSNTCCNKIHDESLKKGLYKLIMKACKKCIIECKKHDHKECKECVKACQECIKMCEKKCDKM